MALPDIYSYEDYRRYLRDWFKACRRSTGQKAVSEFARLAGCSPSHVHNVVSGRRSLRQPLVPGFCRALALPGSQADYFSLLVRCAHPTSSADQRQAAEQLERRRERAERVPAVRVPAPRRPRRTSRRKSPRSGPSPWYVPVVRAMTECPRFRSDPGWVARMLRPPIGRTDAAAALALLKARPDVPTPQVYSASFIEQRDMKADQQREIFTLLQEGLTRARGALHVGPGEAQQFRASVWPVPESAIKLVQTEVEAFQREIVQLLEDTGAEADPDVVYQVMVQVFPLSAPVPRDGGGR